MAQALTEHLAHEIKGLKTAGLYKTERVITSIQAGTVTLKNGKKVINLCANNYLGLSGNPDLIEAGRVAL